MVRAAGSDKVNPNDPASPYWSIGRVLKMFFPLVRGNTRYGHSIPAGDYLVQYDLTTKGKNYHFDEHLNIETRSDMLVQKIDVWRNAIPDGKRQLIYSADLSKGVI